MNKNDYKFQLGDFEPIAGMDKYLERTDNYLIHTLNKCDLNDAREVLRPVFHRRFGLILYNSLLIATPFVAGFLLSQGLEALTN